MQNWIERGSLDYHYRGVFSALLILMVLFLNLQSVFTTPSKYNYTIAAATELLALSTF